MIPSFYPARERRESDARARATGNLSPAQQAMLGGVGPQRQDSNSGLGIRTLAELLDSSRRIRYPDAPHFSYPDMLARETPENITRSPFTANEGAFWVSNRPRIAVIGGGMSGLLSAWQLSKLGAHVDLWEASAEPSEDLGNPRGAGRIRPVNVTPGDSSTRAELGAMRFPDTSYLFWHYLRLMLYPSANPNSIDFTEFPNPGKIPTYLSGERTLSPLWPNGGIGELYNGTNPPDFNYHDLQNRHFDAFLNVRSSGVAGLTLSEVTGIMISGNASAGDLQRVAVFWGEISGRFHRLSYLDFLRKNGFTELEIQVLGFLGIGTGGFEALFQTSVLDVMRLFVWNYAAEYAVPDLFRFPSRLTETVRNSMNANGGAFRYNTRVNNVFYHPTQKYTLRSASGDTGGYDYVVLAMSHKAAFNMLNPRAASVPVGFVQPYSAERTSLFRDDISAQQGMPSVKIFQTAGGPQSGNGRGAYSSVTPLNNATYGRSIRVVFGKHGTDPVGVTYMLPRLGQVFENSNAMVALQYSWGIDSRNLAGPGGLLRRDPNVHDALEATGVYVARNVTMASSVGGALQSRLTGKQPTANVANHQTHPSYFFPIPASEGYMAIVDWDRVPNVNMGFKLDTPSRGLPSINQYRFVALTTGTNLSGAWDTRTALDNSVAGIYFCGCSFSYYGGWVEGAFQGALNATAGIVYAAARASGRLNALSAGARALVERNGRPTDSDRLPA